MQAKRSGYRACKVCKPDQHIKETFLLDRYQSPLGIYILASSQWGLVGLKTEEQAPIFIRRWEQNGIDIKSDPNHARHIKQSLDAYFAGQLNRFNLPIDLRGSPFQRQIWDLLRAIPWGVTWSYGQIALKIKRPKAARAVGRAVGTNPVSIVVPCHRVIGSTGSLTGYGGGLKRKAAILRLEGVLPHNTS